MIKNLRITRRQFVGSATAALGAAGLAGDTFALTKLNSPWAMVVDPGSAGRGPARVIIDTDPGVDDALALLLAMRSPELRIEAITPVAGNVPLELTLPNALRLV